MAYKEKTTWLEPNELGNVVFEAVVREIQKRLQVALGYDFGANTIFVVHTDYNGLLECSYMTKGGGQRVVKITSTILATAYGYAELSDPHFFDKAVQLILRYDRDMIPNKPNDGSWRKFLRWIFS